MSLSVQGQVADHWDKIKAAAERMSVDDDDRRAIWNQILRSSPTHIEQVLISPRPEAKPFRALFPFQAVLSRTAREEHLRASALTGSSASIYAKRWSEDAPSESYVDILVANLLTVVDSGMPAIRDNFTDFVVRGLESQWLISADFCLHDDTRINDVFAFSVFPVDGDILAIMKQIGSIFPRDAKNTKNVSSEMVSYLRSHRRFHFAFIVNRNRRFIADAAAARDVIDVSIDMMTKSEVSAEQQDALVTMRRLRQEASAKSFNVKLFQDTILFAAFGGFIAMLLQLEGRAELIALFSDRDAIVDSTGSIAYQTFARNASGFALRRRVPEANIGIGLAGPRTDGRRGIYADELIRIPDFLASGLSGTDLSESRPGALNQKAADLVEAIADSSNIVVIRVNLSSMSAMANHLIISLNKRR